MGQHSIASVGFGIGDGCCITRPLRPMQGANLDYGVTSWLVKHSPYKDKPYQLLLILAYHADRNGVCWPSVPLLAQETRFSQRTVQRLLRRLESEHAIVIHRNPPKVNRYTIQFDTVWCHSTVTLDGDTPLAYEEAFEEAKKKQAASAAKTLSLPVQENLELIRQVKTALAKVNSSPEPKNYALEAKRQLAAARARGIIQ